MQVQRLDVGADVVYLPERELLVIHPDLDYADSVGAVAGTFPDMHLDVVIGLVERVTPRPKARRPVRLVAAVASAVASAVLALVATMALTDPAIASPPFGEVWQHEMQRMGLTCSRDDDQWTCLDEDREATSVQGFRRKNASLYLVNDPDDGCKAILIFDTLAAAQRWHQRNPGVPVVGRVAAL